MSSSFSFKSSVTVFLPLAHIGLTGSDQINCHYSKIRTFSSIRHLYSKISYALQVHILNFSKLKKTLWKSFWSFEILQSLQNALKHKTSLEKLQILLLFRKTQVLFIWPWQSLLRDMLLSAIPFSRYFLCLNSHSCLI